MKKKHVMEPRMKKRHVMEPGMKKMHVMEPEMKKRHVMEPGMKKKHVIPSLLTAVRIILLHIEHHPSPYYQHNLQQLQLQFSTATLTACRTVDDTQHCKCSVSILCPSAQQLYPVPAYPSSEPPSAGFINWTPNNWWRAESDIFLWNTAFLYA